MSRKVLSPDGEEGSRGIIEPKSNQEAHQSRQQEAPGRGRNWKIVRPGENEKKRPREPAPGVAGTAPRRSP